MRVWAGRDFSPEMEALVIIVGGVLLDIEGIRELIDIVGSEVLNIFVGGYVAKRFVDLLFAWFSGRGD